jgi:outer membrane biosynthesis protein TonB
MSFPFDDDDSTGTSYDESEFDDPEADAQMAATEAATAVLKGLTAPRPPTPPTEEELNFEYMNEVDRRLSIANCYRELLENPLFQNPDENTAVAQHEVRQFVVGRLQVLMGARSEGQPMVVQPKSQFADPEVQALRVAASVFQAGGETLRSFAGLSGREVQALKALAAVALKQGMVPAQQPDATAPPRAVQRRKPPTAPVAAPSAPVRPVAPPQPTPKPLSPPPPPAPKPQPVPTQVPVQSRRTPPSRRQARPSAVQAPASTAPSLVKKVAREVLANETGDGGVHETTVTRIQRPAGMVPFPTSQADMTRAIETAAAISESVQLANWTNQDKVSGTF